jgi:hypothetical protein
MRNYYMGWVLLAMELGYGIKYHDAGLTLIGGMFLGFWTIITLHRKFSPPEGQ